jgi:hypothetical protein
MGYYDDEQYDCDMALIQAYDDAQYSDDDDDSDDDYGSYYDDDYEPDFSSEPEDDENPHIVKAALAGLLEHVKKMLEDASVPGCPLCDKTTNLLTCGKCKAVSYCSKEHQKMHWKQHKKVCSSDTNNEHAIPKDAGKRRVLNASKRWTEIDYKTRGVIRKYEWHGPTALAAAARRGHSHIVQYLLEQGADPTLIGCPSEDIHHNALQAAKARLYEFDTTIGLLMKDEARMSQFQPFVQGKEPEEAAMAILSRKTDLMRSVVLLETTTDFWETETSMNYKHSAYSTMREESGYPNNPSDLDALRVAVAGICISPADLSSSDRRMTKEFLAARIKILQDKVAERIRMLEESKKGSEGKGRGRNRKSLKGKLCRKREREV